MKGLERTVAVTRNVLTDLGSAENAFSSHNVSTENENSSIRGGNRRKSACVTRTALKKEA